jgi:hypothetical protein
MNDALKTHFSLVMAQLGASPGDKQSAKFSFVFVGREIIKNSQAQAAHQDQGDVQLRQLKNVGQQKSGHQNQANQAGHALQGFHAMFLWINSETSQREERSKRASFW